MDKFFRQNLGNSQIFNHTRKNQTVAAQHPLLLPGGTPNRHSKRAGDDFVDAPDCEFDLEVIVPLVFNLQLDKLRRVQHLSVTPLGAPPPIELGLGDTLLKAFKKWLSK
jgi:hypothetical protein